jgi:hypothetical protein
VVACRACINSFLVYRGAVTTAPYVKCLKAILRDGMYLKN